MFFKAQYGVVDILLLDECPDSFARRAELLLQQLPYEILQPPLLSYVIAAPATWDEIWSSLYEQVSAEGFSHRADIWHQNLMGEEEFLARPFTSET